MASGVRVLSQGSVIILHESDNVATALRQLAKGSRLIDEDTLVEIMEDIPFGHKVAIKPIGNGDHILKYGMSIGVATEPINKGERVHTHNLKSQQGEQMHEGISES